MSASVEELLEEAQRLAWDLAAALPRQQVPRVRQAAGQLRAQVRAWPEAATAAGHALRSVPLSPVDRVGLTVALQAVDMVAGLRVPDRAADTDLDPRMARIGVLLGAVGDLMNGEPSAATTLEARDAAAVRDKITAVVETCASSTLGFAGVATKLMTKAPSWGPALEAVGFELRRVSVVPPPDRAGRFDDLTAVAGADPSRGGVISRWQAVARGHLTAEAAAVSSASVGVLMDDLALVSGWAGAVVTRVGVRAGVVDAVTARDAAASLDDAGRAWSVAAQALSRVRTGGPPPLVQLETSRQLRDTLRAVFTDPAGLKGGAEVAHLVGEMRRLVGMTSRLAFPLETAVSTLARSEVFLIPTHALAAPSVRGCRNRAGAGAGKPADHKVMSMPRPRRLCRSQDTRRRNAVNMSSPSLTNWKWSTLTRVLGSRSLTAPRNAVDGSIATTATRWRHQRRCQSIQPGGASKISGLSSGCRSKVRPGVSGSTRRRPKENSATYSTSLSPESRKA